MDRNEQIRIEQLVSEIVESDGNGEALAVLNSLLLDRPDLQTYYARCLSMHMLLSSELADSHGYFTSPLDDDFLCGDIGACQPAGAELTLHTPNKPVALHREPNSRWLSGALTAIALSLLIVVLLRGYQFEKQANQSGSLLAEPSSNWHHDVDDALVWTEDTQAANLVSRLTRTSTPSRLLLPSSRGVQHGSPQLTGGTAWMEYKAGSRERGRLIPLPPNTTMDVFIDTDASSHNTLSIVELDSTGLPVGANYSVGNVVGEQEHANLRSGWIGEFSQSNPTSKTKYFLFTGAYLDRRTTDSPYWAPSDFRIYVDSPELIIAGWDDRTYTTAKAEDTSPGETSMWQDCDYNDIRAIVRFTNLDGRPLCTVHEEFVPAIEEGDALAVADELGTGFAFNVRPGEEVYLMVTGYAAMQNAVQVVDTDNQRVLWRHDGIPLAGEWTDQFPADRGVYVIRNLSDRVHSYELQASCLYNKKRQDWRRTPYKLFGENSATAIVGFEDSVNSRVNTDWQDILVAIYRFHAHK